MARRSMCSHASRPPCLPGLKTHVFSVPSALGLATRQAGALSGLCSSVPTRRGGWPGKPGILERGVGGGGQMWSRPSASSKPTGSQQGLAHPRCARCVRTRRDDRKGRGKQESIATPTRATVVTWVRAAGGCGKNVSVISRCSAVSAAARCGVFSFPFESGLTPFFDQQNVTDVTPKKCPGWP